MHHLSCRLIFGTGIASEYSVKCSYLELYNEEITDLLTVGTDVPKVCGSNSGQPAQSAADAGRLRSSFRADLPFMFSSAT